MKGITNDSALQFNDPLKEFRERMEALQLNNPFKQISDGISSNLQQQMWKIQEAAKIQIQESLKRPHIEINAFRLSDSLKEIYERLSELQLNNSFEQIGSAISVQSQGQIKRIQETINSAIDESRNQLLGKLNVAQLHDPFKGLRATINSNQFLDSYKQVNEAVNAIRLDGSLAQVLKGLKTLQVDDISKAISKYEFLAKESSSDPENLATLNDPTLNSGEIQRLATQILDTALAKSEDRWLSAISEIVDEIRAQKNGPTKEILINIFCNIIGGIFLYIAILYAEPYVKGWSGTDKQKAEKQIKKSVLAVEQDSELVSSYRLVSSNTLAVRLKPSSKSALLGKFQFGQVVLLVEKRGDWSLVAWADDEKSLALQGWVFSRYLRKFR